MTQLDWQQKHKDYKRLRLHEIEMISKMLPEKGDKWMQEGSNKDKKGYTRGFNECREMILSTLNARKEELERDINAISPVN